MTASYDLIVIGGGSGGLAHAQRAAEYGVKMLEHARDFGFDVSVNGHAWPDLKKKRDAYISRLNDIYEGNLEKRGVSYLSGQARRRESSSLRVVIRSFPMFRARNTA
jgi:glutathione reductase (NADPH)